MLLKILKKTKCHKRKLNQSKTKTTLQNLTIKKLQVDELLKIFNEIIRNECQSEIVQIITEKMQQKISSKKRQRKLSQYTLKLHQSTQLLVKFVLSSTI